MRQENDRELDPLYLAIGKFLVNWGQIEYELYRCTKIIYARCPAAILPKRFPNTTEGKLELLETALSQDLRLADTREDAQKLIVRIRPHKKLRNELLHSAISGIEDASTVWFMRPPKGGQNGRAKQEQMAVAVIEQHGQEMEDLCFELGYFTAGFERALGK